MLLLGASSSMALEGIASAPDTLIGYTSASFVITYANADTGMWKSVLFVGKTGAAATRLDSIQGTHTNPDTIAKAAGTFENGTTYYYYLELTDSSATTHTTIRVPASANNYMTFTTDDFTQNLTITTGYSTASVIHDSVGYYVAPLDSIVLQYGTVSGTYTVADTITSVTHPDAFALTGLMEGGTYYGRVIAYLADSSITDSSSEYSWTCTDLQYEVEVLRTNLDSLILKVDTVNADLAVDSLILQWGAGLRGITAVADTITTVTEPDTFIITGLVEGGVYKYRLLAFLPDSSAIETTAVATYTRDHNSFVEGFYDATVKLPDNARFWDWEFTKSADYYGTGRIPITTPWIRVHAAIDGEDDAATYDSIEVFIWSWDFGDSTVIDTLITVDADTTTITPLSFRLYPGEFTDTSAQIYPVLGWETFYSVSATMTDSSTASFNDSTLGTRSVFLIIEEISDR